MNKRQQIEAFADDYTAAVTYFYQASRKAGRQPSNAEIVAACPLPTGFGETEAYYVIVAVTMLVDSDMKDEAKDVSNTVKSTSPEEWERRRKRMQEIDEQATHKRRQARLKQVRADMAAAARQKSLDDHMDVMLVQSRARQAEKAARLRLDKNIASMETAAMMSYPRPQ